MLPLWQWERTQVASLHEENRKLSEREQEVARLKLENSELANLQALNELAVPEFSRTELLRLRSEIGKMRANPPDLDKLRQENHQLTHDIQSTAEQLMEFSEMEGYVPSGAWVHSGFRSPEATLRTFFAAINRGDFNSLSDCMGGQRAEDFTSMLDDEDENEKSGVLRELRSLTQTGGYRITGSQTNSADQISLGLQLVAGGIVMDMDMQRFGEEWRIVELFRPTKPAINQE
jgi:hypothetical protein